MPDTAEHWQSHLDQSAHNDKFVDFIDDSEFIDWQITGIFYSTLHIVHSYIHRLEPDTDENKLNRHYKFVEYLQSNYSEIFNAYDALLRLSFLTRYDACRYLMLEQGRVEYAHQLKHEIELFFKNKII